MNDYLCQNRLHPEDLSYSRRAFLSRCGMGLGALGLASLLSEEGLGAAAAGTALSSSRTHFPAKAQHVIHIFAQGAPSQVDTWDPKPALGRYEDQALPGLSGVAMPSPFKFSPRGKSGIEVSEVFSALGEHVDEMAVIRSMHTDIPAHDVATVFMNTGSRLVRPSLGAWTLYGLGSANQNMPAYISLRTSGGSPPGGASQLGLRSSCPAISRRQALTPRPKGWMRSSRTSAAIISRRQSNVASWTLCKSSMRAQPKPAEGPSVRSAHPSVRNGLSDAD